MFSLSTYISHSPHLSSLNLAFPTTPSMCVCVNVFQYNVCACVCLGDEGDQPGMELPYVTISVCAYVCVCVCVCVCECACECVCGEGVCLGGCVCVCDST